MMLSEALRARLGDRYVDVRAQYNAGFRWDYVTQKPILAVHHAQSSRGASLESIYNHHRNTNGWAGIGYHFIARLGVLYYVGDILTVRAHVKGRNHEAVGVCITGDYRGTPPHAEDMRLVEVLWECLQAEGCCAELSTHRGMLPGYTCPGDALQGAVEELKERTMVRPDKFIYWLEEAARQARAAGDADVHDYLVLIHIPRVKAGFDLPA